MGGEVAETTPALPADLTELLAAQAAAAEASR
jgi:hypothetical protein